MTGQADLGRAREAKLNQLLGGLRQGDLISAGAVSIVGIGGDQELSGAGLNPQPDELWNLSVTSEVGWYVVLTGPCDILRSADIEPCLTVCPVDLVEESRYRQLRHGGLSPREFPLPPDKLRTACLVPKGEPFFPIANLRYVTSVLKAALLHPEVRTLRPLTGGQQANLAIWVGRRFARAAHPDDAEEHVLSRAGRLVARLAADITTKPGKRTLQHKLVMSSDRWLVVCAERSVEFFPVLTPDLAKQAGLFDSSASQLDITQVKAAARKLAQDFAAAITPGSAFQVRVSPTTWEAMSAGEFLNRPLWTWETFPDPLVA